MKGVRVNPNSNVDNVEMNLGVSSSMNPYLNSLRPIWDQPTCVFVDTKKLVDFAAGIAFQEFPVPDWRAPVFPTADDEIFINFIGVGNTINFAFSDFTTGRPFTFLYQGAVWHGAFAMWAALSRALDEGFDFRNLDWLDQLSISDVTSLFRGEYPMPMLEVRTEILQNIGGMLRRDFEGTFATLLHRSGYYAFGENGIIAQLLRSFPSFRDESLHRKSGVILKFQKRAQLFAMMYQGRAMSSNMLPQLKDYASVGPIADYSVPAALRAEGILRYSQELDARIVHGDLIPKDSIFEQEIRAQTINAQIMLLSKINQLRKIKTNYLALDYKLWTQGREISNVHHLTETHAY